MGSVRRPPIQYRFLRDEVIEAEAEALLAEYEKAVAPIPAPPVPVEAIVDCHLELALRFDDLVAVFGDPTMLGATDPGSRTLYVSHTLDPTEHPAKAGRGRFTIAHEVGHWRLHVPILLAQARQQSLFDDVPPPMILCRAGAGARPREEIQADLFAGFLLMPKDLVLAAWKERFGAIDPLVVSNGAARPGEAWTLDESREASIPVAKELAARFEVSGQAMQIRLSRLGLFKPDPRQLDLA
jgi:hypothetical protein